MPLLDVSELLGDPDFFDNYPVLRANRTIDQHGRVQNALAPFTIVACIQPATSQQVEMLPEATRISGGTIAVVTQTRLVALSPSTAGDIVQYKSRNWRVVQIDDWSEWGEGYYLAMAQLMDLDQSLT